MTGISMDVETLLPKSSCTECGYIADAAAGTTEPEPGDLSLCLQCACLNVFAEDLTLRAATVDEVFEANKDDRVRIIRSAIMQVQKRSAP